MTSHEYDPASICDYVPPNMADDQASHRWVIAFLAVVIAVAGWGG